MARENELLAAMWINLKNPYILKVRLHADFLATQHTFEIDEDVVHCRIPKGAEVFEITGDEIDGYSNRRACYI